MYLTRWIYPFLSLFLLVFLPHAASAYFVKDGTLHDATGERIQLRGINWFGFETHTHLVHGLWRRSWREMLIQMRSLGFNAVRLPLCPATLHGAPLGYFDPKLNPDLVGKNSLGALDLVVHELSAKGFYILLDHHSSDCNSISELWYSDRYTEADWIADLVALARRYGNVPGVIGVDLKNEPHGAATWGNASPATDWNHAAERAGAQVLHVAPHWLIFVEGVGNQASGACASDPGRWWGGNLASLVCMPLDPHSIPSTQLVFSPHVYGPDVGSRSYFNAPDFPANMPTIWNHDFGFLDQLGHAWVLGEFGGWYGRWGYQRDRQWQDALVNYLIAHGHSDGFYWSWNPNSDRTGGILDYDWQTVRPAKLALLHRLWRSRTK